MHKLALVLLGFFASLAQAAPAPWEQKSAIHFDYNLSNMNWSPKGDWVALGDMSAKGYLHLWDLHSDTTTDLEVGRANFASPVWSPDETQIVTEEDVSVKDGYRCTYSVWNTQTTAMTLQFAPDFLCFGMQAEWSPDGQKVLTTSYAAHVVDGMSSLIDTWEASSGKHIRRFDTTGLNYPRSAIWSPDGMQIGWSNAISKALGRMWDATTGQLTFDLDLNIKDDTNADDVKWSPDGKKVAVLYSTSVVSIWDATTGQYLMTVGQPKQDLYAAWFEWSPDGSKFLIANDKGIELWDISTLTLLWQRKGFQAHWNPDGSEILVTHSKGNTIDLADPATGSTIQNLTIGNDQALAEAFYSPDGSKLMLVGQYSGSDVTIWQRSQK